MMRKRLKSIIALGFHLQESLQPIHFAYHCSELVTFFFLSAMIYWLRNSNFQLKGEQVFKPLCLHEVI